MSCWFKAPASITVLTAMLVSGDALFAQVTLTASSSPVMIQDSPMADHHATSPLPPVSCFAIPSNNPRYIGYYVGGGCGCRRKAEPRRPEEGTWGWDYRGALIPRLVDLGWWHGRRYQHGSGAYKTDGPQYHEAEYHEAERDHHP
jgi:hypothetical protein